MPVTHSSCGHMLTPYEMGEQEFKNRWMPKDVSSSWKNKLGMGAWSLKIAKKKPNKQTYKTNTKGKWIYFKERVLAISHDYRLDWSNILHISLFQLQQRCHSPSLSSNLRKFKVKCKNYKKLAEKSNSFKTNKSVTNITMRQIVY